MFVYYDKNISLPLCYEGSCVELILSMKCVLKVTVSRGYITVGLTEELQGYVLMIPPHLFTVMKCTKKKHGPVIKCVLYHLGSSFFQSQDEKK